MCQAITGHASRHHHQEKCALLLKVCSGNTQRRRKHNTLNHMKRLENGSVHMHAELDGALTGAMKDFHLYITPHLHYVEPVGHTFFAFPLGKSTMNLVPGATLGYHLALHACLKTETTLIGFYTLPWKQSFRPPICGQFTQITPFWTFTLTFSKMWIAIYGTSRSSQRRAAALLRRLTGQPLSPSRDESKLMELPAALWRFTAG